MLHLLCQRANKPKLSADKVLLVSSKAKKGRGIQPVLDVVISPLKTMVSNSHMLLNEPACPGLGSGQESASAVQTSAPDVPNLSVVCLATMTCALVTSSFIDYCNTLRNICRMKMLQQTP